VSKPKYSFDAPDQARLKTARLEIEAILQKHDLAGAVVLHTPGMSEWFYQVRPSYSCLWIDEAAGAARIKAKLADYGGDKAAQPVMPEPDCWAVLTPNGSRLVSRDEAKGRVQAYPLYAAEAATALSEARCAQLQAEIESLRAALKWYADGEHFTKADPDAWDTVSGEPQNWWCDEADTAMVEDGSLAGMVLAGKLTGQKLAAIEDGEDVTIDTALNAGKGEGDA